VNAAQLEDELTATEVRVSGFARAVAMKRATIVAVVGFLLVLAAGRGWITPGLSGTMRSDVNAALDFLTVVGAGAWIHRAVTPAKQSLQPVNSAGQNLVPDPSASNAMAVYSAPDAAAGAALDDVIAAGMVASIGSHAADTLTVGDGQQPAQPDPFMQGGAVPPSVTVPGSLASILTGDALSASPSAAAGASGQAAVNQSLTAAPSDASAMGGTAPDQPTTGS